MTRFPFMASICASAVLVTGVATVAQAQGRERPSFEMLDRDGSGEITPDEMRAMREARFAENDANGDGLLSRDEMKAAAAKRAEARIDRMMTWMDADGDGALSVDEMAARHDMSRAFERMDRDGSGGVSKDEFREGRERMRGRMHGGRWMDGSDDD
ncbi:EF-hand domain-containing protein [Aestuariivita boseongensis]|uniref:EF-hand domain-containing protein n=1 Tax=Aestuariivita boseongensis TaxID=1470562 RepID=UPI0006826F6E|nr:EF-hand domain-containing protein [Aestuariivita boseongensis]